MISGADAFPDGLDQERFEGSDTGTADEWLSFCDSGFPSVVRVEDLGCIGIVVRFTQGGLEVAVPSGAATPGMPDAVAVEVSSEPGSYRPVVRRAPKQFTPNAPRRQRLPGAHGQSSRGAQRTTLSARNGWSIRVCAERQSATSVSGATACARAGALLGGGAHPGGTRGQMHCQTSAPPVKPLTSQHDRLNEATSLSGALLRIANALEQKHGSPVTVHDAFGLNPAIANKRNTMPSSGISPLARLLELPGLEARH